MKIAVIGGGISGISSARMLKDLGHEVTVFEKNEQIGGLIECQEIDSVLFHKTGGHVFNSKNPAVLDWFWQFFDQKKEFLFSERNAKILLGKNKYIDYPIENNIYQLDKQLGQKIIHELLQLDKDQKPNNFKEFLKNNFGATLYEIYFKNYNEKIWQTDLSEVSLDWLEGKLPFTTVQEILVNNIYRVREKSMVHSTFSYPVKGGSQFIINRLAEGLCIKLNHSIDQIEILEDNTLSISNEIFDRVIFTGDVRMLNKILRNFSLPGDMERKLVELKSNGTSTILCEVDKNDMSWMYMPQTNTFFHRFLYTGNFSKWNNGNKERLTCTLETTREVSEKAVRKELNKLPGNPKLLSINRSNNSYVIQDKTTRPLISNLKSILAPKGIYLVGRFAEWEYYNMDKAIEASLNLVKEI